MAISKFITRAEVPNNVPNNVPSNGIYDLISRGIQDAKNYASIPATYAAGLYGNYINKNVGENMARSFRTDEMNERLSQQVGDQLPPGVNSGSLTYTDFGLPAGPSKYLGDGKFEPNRMFTAPTFKETMNVNSADLANAYTLGNLNFNRNPSGDINYTGNTYDFPQPTFMNNNPMDIPLDELNVNAPEFRFTDYLQGNYDINKFDERPSENTLQARQTRQASSARSLGMDKEIQKEKGIFSLGNILADLGRKGVEGFKDVAGRGIGFNVGTNAGYTIGGIPLALAGGVFGALKGGDMFNKNTLSQRTFDSMTPGQQSYTSGLYGRQSDGTPGLLEGYNQISGTGKGAIGTLGDRLSTIQNTLTRQGANPSTVLQQREQQIKDAINRSINIGEGEALADPNKTVGGIRTDIDVADGGAETSNGKSIVCTAMYQTTGLQDWAKAMKVWYIYQKRHLSDAHQEGYHLLFKPFVKGMHKNKIIRAVGAHVAKHRTQELKHILFNSKSDTLGKIYNKILEPICYIVGKIKFIFKKNRSK